MDSKIERMMASQGDKGVPEDLNYNIGESIIHPGVTWTASPSTELLPSEGRENVPTAEGHRGLQIPLETVPGSKKKTLNVNYVTGNTGVKFIQAHNEDSKDSMLKNILDQSQLRLLAEFDPRTFLKTEMSDKCEKIVQIRGFVTIITSKGHGKTITSLYLLKSLMENESRKPFILTDPYQWDLIPVHKQTDRQDKYAVLIDDVFGRSRHNPDLLKSFEQRRPMIMSLIEAGIVSLIITSRTNIFSMCKYNHPSSVVQMSISLYDIVYTAAKGGQIEVIKCFFKGDVDLRMITTLRRSLLYCAVEHGHTELVKYLDGKEREIRTRDVGEDEDTQFESGEQAYMELITHHFGINTDFEELAEIARFLVRKEASHGKNGQKIPTETYYCRETLHARMSKCLFGKETHLERGHTEMVKFLVEEGAYYGISDTLHNSLLHIASREGHTEIIKYLIGKGADLEVRYSSENSWDIWGYSPLQIATENGQSESVKCLIEIGANLEVSDMWWYSPLQMATEKGHTETARILIEKGANLNVKNIWGYSPLHIASEKGHEEIATILIKKGANLNVQNRSGYSPLHIAIEKAHEEIATILIKKGANLNVQNPSGYSPLQAAIEKRHTEIARILIDKGADLNVRSWSVYSPLQMATEKKHTEIVKYLAEKGADLNVADWWRNTPLHMAAKSGNTEIVKYLIANGADLEVRNYNWRSPLNVAAGQGHLDLVKYLINAGAALKTTKSLNDKDGKIKEVETSNDPQTRQLYLAAEKGNVEMVRCLGGKGITQGGRCILS